MKVIQGDLIKLAKEGNFEVVVHGCNCFHTMGSGIASQMRATFPKVFEADLLLTRYGDRTKLGDVSLAVVDVLLMPPGKLKKLAIVNAYTQFGFGAGGPHINYDAVRSCMKKVKLHYGEAGLRIGYPRIGAGLAGGDWNIISKIIDEELEGEDHTLVEYVP